MKIILASILSLLASSVGATSLETTNNRDLQDDRYHIYQDLSVALAPGTNGEKFLFKAPHREGDSGGTVWTRQRYMYLFKKCPHGEGPDQAADPTNTNFLGKIPMGNTAEKGTKPAWIEVDATSPTVTGSYTTNVIFKVLPTVAAVGSPVWSFDVSDPTAADKGTAEFCVFFGLGNKEGSAEVYGFREIIVKAEFLFDGVFKCVSFTTQAYDPVTGAAVTTKKFGAKAENCSPLTPVRPGTPVCIEVCADPQDKEVYIDTVNAMFMCEDPAKTSAPDETWIVGKPGTSAPPATAGTMYKIICDDENDKLGDNPADNGGVPASGIDGDENPNPVTPYARKVGYGCCRVLWTLPARYFPTVDTEQAGIPNPTNPDIATFDVCGEVDVRPMPLGSTAASPKRNEHGLGCKKVCKRVAARRELRSLQDEDEAEDNTGVLVGNMEFAVLPAEESSSKALGAGVAAAAAAGALGAALLL